VLNYIQRHRNKSQSQWFINDFVRNSAPNLDTLQTKLLHGDNTFIDKPSTLRFVSLSLNIIQHEETP